VVDCKNGKKPNGRTSPRRRLTLIPALGEIDGRSTAALYYTRLVDQITTDLGGVDALSAAQLELARRASGLGILATMTEAQLLEGREDVDLERYIQACHAQVRALCALGLKRRARPIGDVIVA
jgi:hypothetical protein